MISIERFGPDAFLLTCEPTNVAGLTTAIRARFPAVRAHGGENAILLQLPPEVDAASTLDAIGNLEPLPTQSSNETVVLPVTYDGQDLAAVSAATNLSVDDVIRVHCAPTYVSMFCGFAPGFSYLSGLDPQLHLPRRASPRPQIPAGSVSISAHYCAVYPNASPGGWHLLGTCDVALFDPAAEVPVLLPPGTQVRFEPIP